MDSNADCLSDTLCFGQPWVWQIFRKWTCDGLCRLQVFGGFGWNIKSSFNCKLGPLSDTLQAGAWLFPPLRKWPNHVGKFLPTTVAITFSWGQNGVKAANQTTIVQLGVFVHYMLTQVASLNFLTSGQYGLCFGYGFQVRSLYIPIQNRSPSWGYFWESLVF